MRILTLILAFTGLTSSAFARGIPDWPVDKLLKESHVVVIAVANATDDTKDSFQGDSDLIGQNTTFTVRSTFKGKVKATQKIAVLHFRLKKGIERKDPPDLVAFKDNRLPDGREFELARLLNVPEYLIYLRARSDGRYEPVSGHYDSAVPEPKASEIGSVQSLQRELDLIVQRQALVARKLAMVHRSQLGGLATRGFDYEGDDFD